jgi:hypothetical protein
MMHEQKRDLKESIRILRTVSEGSPDIVIGHCTLFKRLGDTCQDCPFLPSREPAECKLRVAIKLMEGAFS